MQLAVPIQNNYIPGPMADLLQCEVQRHQKDVLEKLIFSSSAKSILIIKTNKQTTLTRNIQGKRKKLVPMLLAVR